MRRIEEEKEEEEEEESRWIEVGKLGSSVVSWLGILSLWSFSRENDVKMGEMEFFVFYVFKGKILKEGIWQMGVGGRGEREREREETSSNANTNTNANEMWDYYSPTFHSYFYSFKSYHTISLNISI